MEKILVSAEEAGRLLGLSRAQVYGMARRGQLPSVRLGRLVRFSTEALRRWANDRPGAVSYSAELGEAIP